MTASYRIQPSFLAIIALGAIALGIFGLPENRVEAQSLADSPEIRTTVLHQEQEYLLGPGDELSLKVLLEPNYSQESLLVQPDGRVSLVGVGALSLIGKTLPEATDLITQRLRVYLRNPQVALSLVRPKPGIVYVAGAVQQPGMYQLSSLSAPGLLQTKSDSPVVRIDLRVSNILAVTGGVTLDADVRHVEVRRLANGLVDTVDLLAILQGGGGANDVLVNAGDTVFVPKADKLALSEEEAMLLLKSPVGPQSVPVRVLGQVQNPGVYVVDGRSPYLNTALAKAGGFAPQAYRQKVVLRRFINETDFTDLSFDPDRNDLTLRPNDVIVVGENLVYKSGRFMQQVAILLQPFQTVSSVGALNAQTFAYGGWVRSRINN